MNYDIFADLKKTEETVPENENKKLLDIPAEGVDTPSSSENEKNEDEDSSNAEETEDKTSEETEEKKTIEVEKDFPEKDLGVGGASFVDEFLRVATDEQMAMLKRRERTLAGFWNWAYSKVKAEYVKAYGCIDGGVFGDVGSLASEYFSDAVKEGTVVECDEYEVKKPVTPTSATKTETKTETKTKAKRKYTKKKAAIEVAKMAVEDAKKESENNDNKEMSEKEIEKIKERIAILSGESMANISSPAKQSRMSKRFGSIFKR